MWLANALTLSRIPLAVVFWLTYGQPTTSLAIIGVAALTDALDGAVARMARSRREAQGLRSSSIGEWLDPLADKVFVIGVLGAIQAHEPAPWLVIALIAAREVVLIPLVAIYRLAVHGRAPHAFQARPIGKAATIAELAAIVALIINPQIAAPIAIVAAVLGLAAVLQYITRARRLAPV
jgi:cardiolipin synthase